MIAFLFLSELNVLEVRHSKFFIEPFEVVGYRKFAVLYKGLWQQRYFLCKTC